MQHILNHGRTIVAVARKAAASMLLLFVCCFFLRAHDEDADTRVIVLFPVNGTRIVEHFQENEASLARLDSLLAAYSCPGEVKLIVITSTASPEGPVKLNERLSRSRGEALRDYILQQRPELADRIEVNPAGEAWDDLLEAIPEDKKLQGQRVLSILGILDKDIPASVRESRLRALPEYRYIAREYLPRLRYAQMDMIARHTVYPIYPLEWPAALEVPATGMVPQVRAAQPKYVDVPFLAVGTNFLYDMLLTPNVSLEMPIGKRWSVLAEYTFPWWVTADNVRAWQCLKWDVGLRFWPGRRAQDRHDLLRGFFVGLDLGAGYYDLEPRHKGYQGEFQTAGLELGYALFMGTHWRVDICAAGGWMGTKYRYYQGNEDDSKLIYKYDGRFTWLGPTKLGLCVKYVFTRKREVSQR